MSSPGLQVALDYMWHSLVSHPEITFSSYLCLRPLLLTSLITLNVSVTSPSVKTKSYRKKKDIHQVSVKFVFKTPESALEKPNYQPLGCLLRQAGDPY